MIEAWFTSVCQTLTPGLGGTLGTVCVGLAVLMLTMIALGFAYQQPALLAWCRLWSSQAPFRDRAPIDDGLMATWHLYCEVGRYKPRSR